MATTTFPMLEIIQKLEDFAAVYYDTVSRYVFLLIGSSRGSLTGWDHLGSELSDWSTFPKGLWEKVEATVKKKKNPNRF